MPEKFNHINVRDISDNTFHLIGTEWMLVTSGNRTDFNMMTASWGSLGILWNRPIAVCFVRPQRYTFQLMEKYDYFTLNFLEEKYREAMNVCGSVSGRNVNKAAVTGLTPLETTRGGIYFEQSRLVLECHKIYSDDLKAEKFILKDIIEEVYSKGDFHRLYIGEIVHCLQKSHSGSH